MRRNPASAVRPALSGDQVRNGRRPLSARYEWTRAVVNPLGCCAAESCESCANDAHFPGCLGVLRNWPCNEDSGRGRWRTAHFERLIPLPQAGEGLIGKETCRGGGCREGVIWGV